MAPIQTGRATPDVINFHQSIGPTISYSGRLAFAPSKAGYRKYYRQQRQRRHCSYIGASVTERAEEVPLADLQVMLEDAVRQEDYQAAAKLRDELTQRQADSKSMVEEANRRFYDAFQRNDIKAMNDIWGQGEHVQCIHPAAACIAGRENVMESWRMILRGVPMSISLEDVRVYAGDTVAYVTCVEIMDAGDSRGRTAATNVFEKQGGRWVMVLHHGSPTPIFV